MKRKSGKKQERQFYIEFGMRLKLWREAKSIKQADVARAVNLTRTAIIKIENGQQRVSIYLAGQLCKALNAKLSSLFPSIKDYL